MAASFDYGYIQEYDTNLNLSFQQMESRLLRTVQIDKMAATTKYFERLGALAAPNVRSSRFAPLTPSDIAFSRRLVTPTSYELDLYVDSFDKLRMAIDPSSEIVKSQVMSAHRLIDDVIVGALTGNANTSTTVNSAITSVAPLAANTILVNYNEPGTGQSGNTGLTVGKLKAALAKLKAPEAIMDGEEIFCVINQVQTNQLLRDPQVTNIFYQEAKPLMEGAMVAKFLGMTFIRSERIPNSGSVVSASPWPTALIYPESAAKFVWLEPLHARIVQAEWLQGDTYVLKSMASFGATRIWEEKVTQIQTDPTM